MASSSAKLDQALKDLIEAYVELSTDLSEKFEDDEEAFGAAMLESVETSVEGALEEQDLDSKSFAGLLSVLSDALEQIDPVAFDEEGESEEEEEEDDDDDDIEYEDLDEDEDDDD